MKPNQSRTAVGRAGEEAAARHLEGLGYRILARNLRYRIGELDLVAEEDGVLIFIEVKTRTGNGFGSAAEAVTKSKQRQLTRLAAIYLAGTGSEGRSCRFDVVAVEPGAAGGWTCTVIRDAFAAG